MGQQAAELPLVLTVVMPAHNEASYLEAAAKAVLSGQSLDGGSLELVIVENGSTDATLEVANQLAQAHPSVRVLSNPVADYGAALRTGLLAGTGEWAVVFDVDFVDLDFLADAERLAHEQQAAIVVGTKRGPGAIDERSLLRRLVTASFSTLLRISFGLRVSDTHGVKLLHRSALAPLLEASESGREIFDTEVIIRAERAGLTVVELPVRAAEQRPPRSSIVSRIPRTLLGLARLRLSLWRESGR